jgi:hypothetical protein
LRGHPLFIAQPYAGGATYIALEDVAAALGYDPKTDDYAHAMSDTPDLVRAKLRALAD